ncbi:MAG: Wzz/FepE/Etk N-terminal domain-containing protein [Bacteroidales bacterium]|nr:Wzz/FepE/Etk N-terminal domain-containing protein [Bacteroidales bacterium]
MIQDQNINEKPVVTTAEDEDEIDLIGIAKTLWNGRKTLFISIGIGAVLGIFVAITSPKEYTVSTVMVPQSGTDMSKSQLSGLASMAGLNIGMAQSSDLSPVIYPKIVNSVPFKLELMNTPIHFSDVDKPVSIFDYYTDPQNNKPSILSAIKKYTLGLPGVILTAIRKKPQELELPKDIKKGKLINLSKDQKEIIKQLDQKISLAVDKKEGYLTLTVIMPEALAAAELAQKAQELLQREIIKFKVEKSQADLDFIQGRYNVAKAEAEGYQVNIAVNTDRYKNLTSSLPQVKTARVQTKYGIASGVYQDLAKQLEQAKIQVKKDTPVFTIVEPVTIPTERSKPNRPMILIIWLFMGCVIGCGIVYGKQWLKDMRSKWQSTDIQK